MIITTVTEVMMTATEGGEERLWICVKRRGRGVWGVGQGNLMVTSAMERE